MSGIERVKKFQFLFNTVPFVLIIAFQGNDNKFTNDKDNVFDKFQQYFAAVPASIFCCYPHVNISLLSPRQYVAAVPASIFRCYPRVNISLLSPRQYFAAIPASIFRCYPASILRCCTRILLLFFFCILFNHILNHTKFLQLNFIHSSAHIGMRFHLYIFFAMFCVSLFS